MKIFPRGKRFALPGFLVALLLLWFGQAIAEQLETPLLASESSFAARPPGFNGDSLPLDHAPGQEGNDVCLCLNERNDDDSLKGRASANSSDSFISNRPIAIGTRRLHQPATSNNAYRLTAVYLLTQRFRL